MTGSPGGQQPGQTPQRDAHTGTGDGAGVVAHPPAAGGPSPDEPSVDLGQAAAAVPFVGAQPAGAVWLSAPATAPSPSGIEPTTGAPNATLPQRAPRATFSSASLAWDAVATTARSAVPGQASAPEEDDGDFWLPIEEVHWDGRPVQPTPRIWFGQRWSIKAHIARRAARPPKPARRPGLGLAGLVVLALLAAFFAWSGAEPLWLALGHGDRGVATVAACSGHGLGQRCRGDFTSAGGAFTASDVRLVGVQPGRRDEGTQLAARMIDVDSHQAYVGAGSGFLHLHWLLSLLLVLLCGAGISWATGALRLSERRSRRPAMLASFVGPLVLTVGFLAAAF